MLSMSPTTTTAADELEQRDNRKREREHLLAKESDNFEEVQFHCHN